MQINYLRNLMATPNPVLPANVTICYSFATRYLKKKKGFKIA